MLLLCVGNISSGDWQGGLCEEYMRSGITLHEQSERRPNVRTVRDWPIRSGDRQNNMPVLREGNLSSGDRESDMSRLHERYLSNGDRKSGVFHQYLLSREVHVK